MNAFDTYLKLEAFQAQRAVPRARFRHVHLSGRPFVIVGYHLAGDPGAPMALTFGSQHDNAVTVIVPEPRNRALRFEKLAEFGDLLLRYLNQFDRTESVRGRRGWEDVCVDAPQIVLANPATANWLYDIVGRFTRSLPTTGDDPAPRSVVEAGKHLSFFGGMRRIAGSSLTMIATESLTGHYATGQLDGEDQNLEALLGWIEPGEHGSGSAAALVRELRPPAGPISDPRWDADHLQQLIKNWHQADTPARRGRAEAVMRSQLAEQLSCGWNGCWDALDHLRCLPEAAHVAMRWASDRKQWTKHFARMITGEARFRNIPTPVHSARSLRISEDSVSRLESEMALDDPLILARLAASGEALAGHVVRVDPTNTEPGPSRAVRRPLVDIVPSIRFLRPPGSVLALVRTPGVRAEVQHVLPDGTVRLKVVAGANQSGTVGRLPAAGQRVEFAPHVEFYPSPGLPDEVPWTHRLPEEA